MPAPSDPTTSSFTLRVRTPEGLAVAEQVRSIRFPGIDGSFGVRPRHARMMSAVSCGILRARLIDGSRREFAVGEGFAEVYPDWTTLLVDFCNGDGAIDLDRAHGALLRADGRLRGKDRSVDMARAEAALCRAISRLKVCGCGCSLCDKHC